MSQENVEIVKDQYAAVNERDFERAMRSYADDVVLRVPQGIRGGTFHGRDAVGEWFGEWFRTFDRDAHFDIREISEFGTDGVLVVASHRASGRGSGVGVEGIFVWSYRLRDGMVTHVRGFDSKAQALEAAGLPE